MLVDSLTVMISDLHLTKASDIFKFFSIDIGLGNNHLVRYVSENHKSAGRHLNCHNSTTKCQPKCWVECLTVIRVLNVITVYSFALIYIILFSKFRNHLQFYMRIPFKIESDQIKRLTTNWYRLQFYKRNPFKKLSSHFT